ncbi:ABC transporter permease [Clostridium sardiniense]|uniref:ABC transporter permease n=1 Tax=Clostridium sardiniense TaxID=29369 RepID=A0ABS7KTN6_CLOSR|nr:FtsX-like permease family protein [Clostridium sardiniense]MBY0754017.1 ABC transporter permease [Clostridium sardiniense]MDQ0459466.1 putative ABC transport system permease protein [Clostridium sardiniense]
MKFKDYIKMAFSNLGRRKLRTFLTAFAVAIGVMLIITMVSLGKGVENLITDSLEEFNNINSITVIPTEYKDDVDDSANTNENAVADTKFKEITKENINKIKEKGDVQDIVSMFNASISSIKLGDKDVKLASVNGVDTNYSIYGKSNVDSARQKKKDDSIDYLISGDLIKDNNASECMITEKLSKKLGIDNTKDMIGKEIEIIADKSFANIKEKPLSLKVKVVGVINEKVNESDSVITTIGVADKINKFMKNNEYTYAKVGPTTINVNVKNASDVKTINEYIQKDLGYTTFSLEDVAERVKSIFIVIKSILAIGGAIVLFVAALGVINTMVMSIYERTKSIGVMKAVGASKGDIKAIFLVESGAIGFIGGVLGTLFSLFNLVVIKAIATYVLKSKGVTDTSFLDNVFASPLKICLITISFAIIITILAGLYPSSRAAKLNPIDALKYE